MASLDTGSHMVHSNTFRQNTQPHKEKLIYLKTEDSIRYDRLSKRLSITIKQAQEESKIKEHLNNDLGAEEVMALADYVVDGAKSIDEIFEATKQYIEK